MTPAPTTLSDLKGDHLVFCVDTRVAIDIQHFGAKTITWLQSAYYWATG